MDFWPEGLLQKGFFFLIGGGDRAVFGRKSEEFSSRGKHLGKGGAFLAKISILYDANKHQPLRI
jgi:hypothetical protein